MFLIQVAVISYLRLEPHHAVGVLMVAGGFICRFNMVSNSIYIALFTNKISAFRIKIIQIGIITHIIGKLRMCGDLEAGFG